MIVAVVPAAGHSRRMGRPKLALPLGTATVLGRVVAALRQGGADAVLVVVGPHVPELAPLARTAGAEVCLLPAATPDMRATVEAGLAWIEERFRPGPEDAWLLAPADHPTLDADVVRALLAARAADPAASVFVPTWQGKRGHPTLIAWRHVAGIRTHPPGEGLNAYLRLQRDQTREVPANAGILCDLDTPADYERLRQSEGGAGPS
jgi:molybdenum cofactor cytidylyltransferase